MKKVHIIEDDKGKATGVFIPIKEWRLLKKQYKELNTLDFGKPVKASIIMELKQAIKELKLIEQGKLKPRPAKLLLDEL
jgi:hypothetical protein